MNNWYWHMRYWFYCAGGATQRFFGLAMRNGKTLGEVMSGLERSPEMRERLEAARKELGFKRRTW